MRIWEFNSKPENKSSLFECTKHTNISSPNVSFTMEQAVQHSAATRCFNHLDRRIRSHKNETFIPYLLHVVTSVPFSSLQPLIDRVLFWLLSSFSFSFHEFFFHHGHRCGPCLCTCHRLLLDCSSEIETHWSVGLCVCVCAHPCASMCTRTNTNTPESSNSSNCHFLTIPAKAPWG